MNSAPTLGQCRLIALLLVVLSLLTAPFTFAFTLHHYLYFNGLYSIDTYRKFVKRQIFKDDKLEDQRTILITGSRGMKALSLAKAFRRLNPQHRVILADSKNWSITSPSRFSTSVTRHYFSPSIVKSPEEYKRFILDLIRSERVDHWIPCSFAFSTIIDCEIAEEVRNLPGVNCFCWTPLKEVAEELHEKDRFMPLCAEYRMDVPHCSQPLTSVNEAMSFLYPDPPSIYPVGSLSQSWVYILKPIQFAHASERTDLTLLPRQTEEETKRYLLHKFQTKTGDSCELDTNGRPKALYILQRFIKGPEYCTQASVYDNKIRSFVCCKGSDMVMRYEDVRRLPNHDKVSILAEKWTTTFLTRLKQCNFRYDGHFSIDFIYEESEGRLYPIECNPRVHTAVTLFRSVANALAESYLCDKHSEEIVRPSLNEPAHLWMAHSLPLSIFNTFPPLLQRWLGFLHPYLSEDYFKSCHDDRFDPITFSPKPEETPWFLFRSVMWQPTYLGNLGRSKISSVPNKLLTNGYSTATQLDPLWDPEYHPDDLFTWWIMGHVYWIWLLFYQAFIRNEPWNRVNVSTARIWEL
ncbi:uncharacterized protein MELLADRAFT_89847 [Melampsora larici-populina 98AG31]|uniref:ATP-grasp domain-containing protein n=1 Tax=Melampsora larici-populina (strain 98AG31 / pathotype 3-4-7) TaxID=747676 RepID=F4RUU4_MELLP|nr:uncharacterized protein MELLADRAFT_89847 [Melampsora larici-populina 98AG31]EGG03863.1 hypothetical protein MELLADRAFT_89847 [Melampsora larici-populina 98AG31]